MCFQEPFKNINNDGSRTAVIQTLCYVTIQEATRLLPGYWHKEADESLDLARRAGFFPGSERSRSEQGWSLFSCQGRAGFPSAPRGDCTPKNYVTGASMGLFPTFSPMLCPAVCFPSFVLISFKHSWSGSCVFMLGILQYAAAFLAFHLLAATSCSWCCLLLHSSLEHMESPHMRPEYSREHNWKTQVRPEAVQDKLSSPFPPRLRSPAARLN